MTGPPPPPEWFWVAWLVGTCGTFATLETYAVTTGRIPPLTESLARWMGLDPRAARGPWLLLGFAAAWAGVSLHLLTWRTPPRPPHLRIVA